MLKGRDLEGGWTVGEPIDRPAGATGGKFSCCYQVSRKDGARGFLKAADLSLAFRTDDPLRALQALTEAYNFERDLLNECGNRRMDRVVRAISDGKVKVDDSIIGVVQYLIFEEADRDLRAQLNLMGKVETAWKLRSLHNIATGLKQLHGADIAHQDVKPSNVLVFKNSESRVADLGCASKKGTAGPTDHYDIAGDPAYAPPESLYGYMDPEWNVRRFGCDLYHLGSMVVFFITGLTMTSLMCCHI
jgi:serine/threonine protein kinase